MASYQVKSPWWLRTFYRKCIWRMPQEANPAVYLTFDDGPNELATPFVLDELKKFDAKATFFCIGKNVVALPEIYDRVLDEGHTVANHTQNHINGWKTATGEYIANIKQAAKHIDSNLFRPPYGKIKMAQVNLLRDAHWKIYMWDVLSGDFDVNLSSEACMENVIKNIEPGSIVVFHDSYKAWDRMRYALPRVLEYCKKQGWQLKALPKD